VPRPRRILLLLTNPWVQGDATLAGLFAGQLRADPACRVKLQALAQPAALPALRSARIPAHPLAADPLENERRLHALRDGLRPELVLLLELRNFLDQIFPEAAPTPSEPFVPNLRWESILGLGARLATLDNLPGDRFGTLVRATGLPVVVPVPPLDPQRVLRLEGRLLIWNSLRHAAPRPEPRRRARIQVLLTLSEWSAQLAIERGLGLYYLVLERQLCAALERLGRPATLLVAGGPARYFPLRRSGRVRVLPLGAVRPRRFERLLLESDVLVSDHALQLSLVRRLRAGGPSLLIRQSLRYEDRDRPPFALEPSAGHLLELWLKTRPDVFGPWEVFPLPPQPGLLDKEAFHRALPKVELFDTAGLHGTLEALLHEKGQAAIQTALEALFMRCDQAPTAAAVLNELLGPA
jgi:hypothetical protein